MSATLKDIALRCGVSATLVSTVLNHRQGRIGCSELRRRQILAVAAEMNYHPNLLARSMVSRRSPMVGVMLNIESEEFNTGYHSYFNQVFPALTFQLNERNLEVLFVPFHDEKGQMERLDRLHREGLVGGIITNLIPRHYHQIAARLSEFDLPYMILGYPYGFDCHCVFCLDRYDWLSEYQKAHDFRQSFLLIEYRGQLQLLRMPFPEDYYWLAEPMSVDEKIILDPDNLIICSGVSLYHQLNVPPCNVVIMEEPRSIHSLPANVPAFITKSSRRSDIVSLAASNLADWMQNGREPEIRKNLISPSHSNMEVRF